MKQYLKMADVFQLPISDEVYRVDFAVISESDGRVIGGFGIECMSSHAVHAINSHDELVKMNQELLAAASSLVDLIMHPSLDADESIPELVAMQAAIAKAKGGAA